MPSSSRRELRLMRRENRSTERFLEVPMEIVGRYLNPDVAERLGDLREATSSANDADSGTTR